MNGFLLVNGFLLALVETGTHAWPSVEVVASWANSCWEVHSYKNVDYKWTLG
jgi:hypothetical protein